MSGSCDSSQFTTDLPPWYYISLEQVSAALSKDKTRTGRSSYYGVTEFETNYVLWSEEAGTALLVAVHYCRQLEGVTQVDGYVKLYGLAVTTGSVPYPLPRCNVQATCYRSLRFCVLGRVDRCDIERANVLVPVRRSLLQWILLSTPIPSSD